MPVESDEEALLNTGWQGDEEAEQEKGQEIVGCVLFVRREVLTKAEESLGHLC